MKHTHKQPDLGITVFLKVWVETQNGLLACFLWVTCMIWVLDMSLGPRVRNILNLGPKQTKVKKSITCIILLPDLYFIPEML